MLELGVIGLEIEPEFRCFVETVYLPSFSHMVESAIPMDTAGTTVQHLRFLLSDRDCAVDNKVLVFAS